MGNILLILAVVAAILLVLVILIQNPKGGGIDSSFGAANQLGSVQKTTDVVEKATWYLAGFILVVSIISVMYVGPKNIDIDSKGKFDPNYQINSMPVSNPVQVP